MPIIEVTNLTKRYAGRTILDGVTFSVEEGEIFGILGPNGTGKTTTVEIIEGLKPADSGSVCVMGLDPIADGKKLKEFIGVQLQHTDLPDNLKVWEALDLYGSFYENPRDCRELMEEWGLGEFRDRRFGKLSSGQRQRLIIALALVGNPRVAFFDEVTTGLDPQARRATWQLIKQIRAAGVTVVLVSHFMDEVEELCNRVAVFNQGRIVALDTPAKLIDSIDAEHSLRFRVVADAGDEILDRLRSVPGVASAKRTGDVITVSGKREFAVSVTALLAREHVVVTDLRIDKRTLDDAFAALTGRELDV